MYQISFSHVQPAQPALSNITKQFIYQSPVKLELPWSIAHFQSTIFFSFLKDLGQTTEKTSKSKQIMVGAC